MSPQARAAEFLKISHQFKLGHLVTEGFNPKTTSLSSLVKSDLKKAFKILEEVDHAALGLMRDKTLPLWNLALAIESTLQAGNKIFLCGCGATGRLSLVLETLYRQKNPSNNNVISFMAGGDYALIKSVESFEDKTHYGERQLLELGFGKDDLLISSTEGGETPFVIGATNTASLKSSRSPYFLYCNPDEVLKPIERSREVLENKNINKINLTVGPMAISGSTRMQASTVLMLGIGMGLLYNFKSKSEFESFYEDFLDRLTSLSYEVMAPFTFGEAKVYQDKKYVNYLTDEVLGISILTDTTERSPTFSLRGFESHLKNEEASLSYLFLNKQRDSRSAWRGLLQREPRVIEWDEVQGRINFKELYGFDISSVGLKERQKRVDSENFEIVFREDSIYFSFLDQKLNLATESDQLYNHLMIKMLLNAHSTLLMGILDRYEGNVMTWVRPSNNKLIDRAARYCLELLGRKNKIVSYEEVVLKIFKAIEDGNEHFPVVLKVVESFS